MASEPGHSERCTVQARQRVSPEATGKTTTKVCPRISALVWYECPPCLCRKHYNADRFPCPIT